MRAIIEKIQLRHVVLAVFFFAGSYFFYPIDYDNTASRLYLVSAMVDYGTLQIEPYAEMTIDKSFNRHHFYSNKAIGGPLLAAPVYWLYRRSSAWCDQPPLEPASRYVIRLMTTTVPFAFLGVVLLGLARRRGPGVKPAFCAAIAYGLGSIALIHASMFSGHGMAAAFAFFSFAALVSLKDRPTAKAETLAFPEQVRRRVSGRNRAYARGLSRDSGLPLAVLAGLSAGVAGLCDYTAMYTAIVLSLFALATLRPIRLAFGFLSGGLVCVLVLAAYNWRCFGSPLSFSYASLAMAEWAQLGRHGLLGITWPRPGRLAALLFSPARGLLAIMPVFVFAFLGWWHMFRYRARRPEALVILAVALGYFMINAGFYGWHGGWTYGPRYLVPALPFLAFAMVFAPREPLAFGLCLTASALQVTLVLVGLPHAPEQIRNPLVELVIPCMRQGYLAESWPAWLGAPRWIAILVYVSVLGLLLSWAWKKIMKEETGCGKGHGSLDVRTGTPSGRRIASKGWRSQLRVLLGRMGVRDWRLALPIGLWLTIIAVMLAVVRTSPPEIVAYYRERLLFHLRNEKVVYRHLRDLNEAYRILQMNPADTLGTDGTPARSHPQNGSSPADP